MKLKGYSNHKGESLFIVNNNQKTNINFQTNNGYDINTSDYNFSYEEVERGKIKSVIMKLVISEFQSISLNTKFLRVVT